MFIHLPAFSLVTARTLGRIQHAHSGITSLMLARSISTTSASTILSYESAKVESFSVNQVLLQFMHDWKEDRHRWERDRQRWESERRNFYATDKSQSVMIAELKKEALGLLEKELRLERNFNVRGGLERICYHAVLEKRINPVTGVQLRLDELAKTPGFLKIYRREIEARRLTLPDVERCRRNIYHEVSKHAHGNDGVIRICHTDFTVNETAAVLAYFKMQDSWKDCLKWEEHIVKKDTVGKIELKMDAAGKDM